MKWIKKLLKLTGLQPVKAKPVPHIYAKVYRAATGKWEDLGRIS